jgi:formamidopyrimidine-DNA glycosylase
MPELPEVETIKNELSPWVMDRYFTQVTIFDSDLVPESSAEEFRLGLVEKAVKSLERRGKYLIFNLTSNQALIMHFRMTGVLLLNPSKVGPYARANFTLSNDIQVVFSDRRRLGVMWLVQDIGTVIGKLGPEPLSKGFTPVILAQRLGRHRIPIKAALLDQSLIAGIGNMYADEALFDARIHPLRKADALSIEEIQDLHHSIRCILQSAIGNKGASVDSYVRPGGQLGTAHFKFKVAHRYGESCTVCGTPIRRILVRNRGSYFCPKCQPVATQMPLLPP